MDLSTGLPQGDAKATAVREMFDTIAPRYDTLNRILTFRMDVGWRRRAIRELDLPAGSVIIDQASGTGDFCRELEERGYRPIGLDLSYGMLAAARTRAPLVQGDALRLPFADGSVDGITSGYGLRNMVELVPVFAECARVLRPGGRLAILEVSEPANPLLRTGHQMYFNKVVPLVGGLLSDKEAYAYLPRSVEYLPDEYGLRTMITNAGFTDARHTALAGGVSQLITATRRS